MEPPRSLVGLSTSSVYPESTSSAFEIAAELGFDGVEVMVGIDAVSADVDALEHLRDYHQIPVLAVHAPVLLVTQAVWGADPWGKLERSIVAAERLGAGVVVAHPPFRWQRGYADVFEAGIRRLNESTDVALTVENMFPWRTPGGELKAYAPHWDPSSADFEFLTLDLSHSSTSRQQSLALVSAWGSRLSHVHLTDGTGAGAKDEHLLPGRGDQRADEVLRRLAADGYGGHIVLEVNTRKSINRDAREAELASGLDFVRHHLWVDGAAPVTP